MSEKQLTSYSENPLANLRKAAGLSQRKLARLLEVHPSNISFWERANKTPRAELLPKIAEILCVSVECLLNLEKVEKKVELKRPKGKLAKVIEQAAELPKHQQDKIADFVSVFLQQYQLASQNKTLDLHNKQESSAA